MAERVKGFSIEHAKIVFRNFAGDERQFNTKGNRNFSILLESDIAKTLIQDGWNVRYLEPRDEAEERQGYISVRVSFDNVPPKIVLVTKHRKTILDEEDVKMLDYAEIANVDIIINPYTWTVSGKSGIKAYVKSMYVTIVEDEFEDKYYEIPNAQLDPMPDNNGN